MNCTCEKNSGQYVFKSLGAVVFLACEIIQDDTCSKPEAQLCSVHVR